MNLSKLYCAGNLNIIGHVFNNKDSVQSDYEIEHCGSIQCSTSEDDDGNNDQEKVEEHKKFQHEGKRTSTSTRSRLTNNVNEEWRIRIRRHLNFYIDTYLLTYIYVLIVVYIGQKRRTSCAITLC